MVFFIVVVEKVSVSGPVADAEVHTNYKMMWPSPLMSEEWRGLESLTWALPIFM